VGLSQISSFRVSILYLFREVGGKPAALKVPQPLPFVPAVGHLAVDLDDVSSLQVKFIRLLGLVVIHCLYLGTVWSHREGEEGEERGQVKLP